MAKDLNTEHREFMSWNFSKNAEMYDRLNTHGSKISQIGIFDFAIDATGTITGTPDATTMLYVNKYPHINWYLCIRNDGYESIFEALVKDPTAQSKFLSEVERIMDTYSWCDGLDVDLERGPNDARAESTQLLLDLAAIAHIRGKKIHIDLPPKQGDHTPYWEEWCDYRAIKDVYDSYTIMSYAFAWAGSTPGPIAPEWWMKEVYDYATDVENSFANPALDPNKLFMGLPAFGFRWQIYDYPENLGKTYRGAGGFTKHWLDWMNANYSHTDQYRGGAETQPYIPFASQYDEENKCNFLLLHVYDYIDWYNSNYTVNQPMVRGTYSDAKFITCYTRQQKETFTGLVGYATPGEPVDAVGLGADYFYSKNLEQVWNEELQMFTDETPGYVDFTITVPTAGNYDIGAKVLYPWWDKQTITVDVNGVPYSFGNHPQYYPYHRQVHYDVIKNVPLSAGVNTLTFQTGSSSLFARLYELVVASDISTAPDAGDATAGITIGQFLDKNGELKNAYQDKYKVTLEVIRRAPESAVIWYDDFADYASASLSTNYDIFGGTWMTYLDPNADPNSTRPNRFLIQGDNVGLAQMSLGYAGFGELEAEGNFKILSGTGHCGFLFGGGTKVGITGTQIIVYDSLDNVVYTHNLSSDYTDRYLLLRARIRGTTLRVTTTNNDLLFECNVGQVNTGTISLYSLDKSFEMDYFRVGDAYYYQPQEALKLVKPDGAVEILGREARTGVTWLDEWQLFKTDSVSVEERDTRTKSISNEWDFLHSTVFVAATGGHQLSIEGIDRGVWVRRAYVIDNDGASVVWYPDARNFEYFANMAKHRYKLKGTGIWALGQHDEQIFQHIPDIN